MSLNNTTCVAYPSFISGFVMFVFLLSVVCVCNASLLDAPQPNDNQNLQENTLNVQELSRGERKSLKRQNV